MAPYGAVTMMLRRLVAFDAATKARYDRLLA